MKGKRILLFVFVCIWCFSCCSCTLDDTLTSLAFVNAASIGITQQGKIKTDFYIPQSPPQASASDAQPAYKVISAQGDSFEQCIIACEKQLNQALFFGQLKTLLLSNTLIQNADITQNILYYFCRNKNFNLSTNVFAIDDQELLASKIKEGDETSIDFLGALLAKDSFEENAILGFYEIARGNGAFALPGISVSSTYSIDTLYIMQGYKSYAKYKDEDVISYSLLTKTVKRYFFHTPHAELSLLESNAKIKVDDQTFVIEINAHFEIVSNTQPLQNIDKTQAELITNEITRALEERLTRFIAENSKGKNIYQLLGLEAYMKKYYPNRLNEIHDMPIALQINAKLLRSGTMR